MNGFKIYIERNEKPYNYMTYDEEEEKVRRMEHEMELAKIGLSRCTFHPKSQTNKIFFRHCSCGMMSLERKAQLFCGKIAVALSE